MSEMASTRAIARRRGTTVPGWNRWARSFAGTASILLLVTFVTALVLGPGFIEVVVDALAMIWRGFAMVILWVLYGIVYVFVYIYRAVAWLLGLFFDAELPEVVLPEQGEQATPPATEMPEQGEVEPWWFAPYLRFAGLIVLVLVGLALLVRFARFRMTGEVTDSEEERSSVFSGSLLKQQIRNLFHRRSGAERPRKLDLASDPASVRESMLYLQALAARLGTPRRPSETPHDFTERLAREWSSLGDPLHEINRRYERVRYGETEDDRAAVVAAWRQIWTAHRDEPGAQ